MGGDKVDDALWRQERMVERLRQLAPSEGYTRSRLDEVTFMRANRPLPVTPALYEPSIVIVVQGRKRGFHGDKAYVYDARQYLVLSVPLPFSIETEASSERPMLGLALRIDPVVTAELATSVDALLPEPVASPAALYSTPVDDTLEDATLRLLEALSSPLESQLLAPSVVREITYRVLIGEQGGRLRAALTQGGYFQRIAGILGRIHRRPEGRFDVGSLAEEAHLSVPAFHVHFKAVTQTSPVQYIKALRLHRARLMMIREGATAVSASHRVGYESPSQFSREFKRFFGRSPVEEACHLKAVLSLGEPASL